MLRSLMVTMCIALGATHAFAVPQAPQASQGHASTTRLVPHSGVLTDAAGHPLTGTHAVTFTLFDHPEGGTVLWTDTVTVTADARGRYAAHLGSGQALPLEIFHSEQARWLGVTVDGHDLPRTMLAAVPYALKAADADTLGGKAASSFLTTGTDGRLQRADGTSFDAAAVEGTGVPGQIAKWASPTLLSSSVISESATNRVGVGLPDPTGGGVVDSVFTIKNYDNNTGLAVLNDANARRFALNTTADGGWLLYDGGNNIWNAGLSQRAGNVAIGTMATNSKLTVTPAANASGIYVNASGTASNGVRGNTVDGYGIIGAASGEGVGVYGYSSTGHAGYFAGPKTYISGNLGVGLTLPADKLDVLGDIRVGTTGTTGCVKDRDSTVIAGTCASDARFKKNITPFAKTLGRLSQLQPVHFDWRAEDFPDRHFGAARSFGLIAQDVEAILPELVVTDAQGFRAVKYSELPLHMLQAIKELKTENDAVKTQNATLRQQLDTQDASLRAQQAQLRAQEERLRRLEALARK